MTDPATLSRGLFNWPEPPNYPGVVKANGGWFAVTAPRQLGSGPWKTREEAEQHLPRNIL